MIFFPRPKKAGACTPVDHVVFLKTHKTASTTVAGIFDRYTLKHHLNLALPPAGELRFNIHELFSRTSVRSTSGKSSTWERNRDGFHMLTSHTRYNRRELDAVVHNAKYVTILREPFAQFVSAFYYFHFDEQFPANQSSGENSVDVFFRNPKKNFAKLEGSQHAQALYNNQLYDLGMDPRKFTDSSAVRKYIKKLDAEFDLVLISDFLDVSLVLLGDLLCWNHSDLFYGNSKATNSTINHPPLPSTVKRIHSWNSPDRELYEFFRKKLWTRVKEYGDVFEDDLRRFQADQSGKMDEYTQGHLLLMDKIVEDMRSRGILSKKERL